MIWPDRRGTKKPRFPGSHKLKISDSTIITTLSSLSLPSPTMLPGSTLELYWDYEVENTLEPSLSISYTGNSALFFSPSPSQYNFSVSHRTYSQDVSPIPTPALTFRPTHT